MDNFEILYRSGMLSKQNINGTPPLTFTSDGSPLIDYAIYGYTSPNLFDISSIIPDSSIDLQTGEIVESEGTSVSDWISISDTGLFFSGTLTSSDPTLSLVFFALYDGGKNLLDIQAIGWNEEGEKSHEITVVEGTAFMRLQLTNHIYQNVMINQGDSVLPYEPFGAVGDKTDNLFYRTAEMDISTNWVGGKFYPDLPNSVCFFIFFPLPTEVKSILKSESNISAKVFRKGSYFNGMVFALTPEIMGSVPTEFRILQNSGEVLDFTQNMSEWDDIYLSLGYGSGIITPALDVDRRAQIIEAFFNNFDLSIISGTTMPEAYEPYGYKIPITCGGITTNIYLDSPLYEGDSISFSTAGVEIPTVEGENTLTVGTTVQPSAVEIKAVKSAALSKADRYFQYLYDVARNRR